MKSDDKDNYGTPFSYATPSEDNEVIMEHVSDATILVRLMEKKKLVKE